MDIFARFANPQLQKAGESFLRDYCLDCRGIIKRICYNIYCLLIQQHELAMSEHLLAHGL